MNDPLKDLGQSLAGSYHEKTTQWSALEFSFSVEDLSASLDFVDDILRLEEGWEALGSLVETMQTGFLPQDLLAVPGVTAELPEQQSQPSGYVRKVENYPFPVQAITGLQYMHDEVSTRAEQLTEKNKKAPDTSFSEHNGNAAFQVDRRTFPAQTSSGNFFSDDHTKSAQPASATTSAAATGKTTMLPPEEMSNRFWNSGLPNQDRSGIPPTLALPQIITREIPNQANISSNSIWSQPLQSISDFATHIVHPVIDKNVNAQVPGKSRIPIPGTDHGSIHPNEQIENDFPVFSGNTEWTAASNSNVETVPLSNTKGYFPTNVQTSDFKASSQPFELEPNRSTSDTDDLLEALTDRILRDFHRYYP